MSDQDSKESATKESQLINATSDNVEAKTNDDQNSNENNNDDINIGQHSNVQSVDEEHQVIRSESVIKSPSKSSCIPVIRVIDTTTNQNDASTSEIKEKSQENLAESGQTTNTQSHSMSTNFLQTKSNFTPSNPFLRASTVSFQNTLNSTESQESSSAKNQIVFAPPTLIPNLFSDKPKNLITNSEKSKADPDDVKKPSETISSSKLFISLNKEDIGKIKTPAFIQNTSLNLSNGSLANIKDVKNLSTTSNDISKSTFLFGQKLEDRVGFNSFSNINNDLKTDGLKSDHLISFSDVTKCDETINSGNSKTESSLLSVIKNGESSNIENVFKRKYEVITGEEDEQNVLTIYGKLFAWESEKSIWVEKGRGHLRLNDVMKNDKLCSRLVMRTTGALRLILNCHIVTGMKFELAAENCLRFTYVDGIYMIKGNPKDIEQLNSAIEHRLREISKRIRTTSSDRTTDEQ